MERMTMGLLLVGVGAFHQLIGLIVGWEHLVEIAQAGGFNTVLDTEPWRMAIFWFLWFGWALMLVGGALHWGERNGLVPPVGLLVGLVALGIGGVFFMPASGFWTVFAVVAFGWGKYFRGRKRSRSIG